MKRNSTTIHQKVAICRKLEEVCHKVEGLAVYDEGFSDEILARELLADYPGHGPGVVADLRRAMVGNFQPPRQSAVAHAASFADMQAELLALMNHVTDVVGEVARLAGEVRAITDYLDFREPEWRTKARPTPRTLLGLVE